MLVQKYKLKYEISYNNIFKFIVPMTLLINTAFAFAVLQGTYPQVFKQANPVVLNTKQAEVVTVKPPLHFLEIFNKKDVKTKKSKTPKISKQDELKAKKIAAVQKFFKQYNAPLYKNAKDFVEAATKYKLDYRLMPAISIVESSGGKHLFKPHNPFGWGKHGYPSFRAAIYDVARGLSVYYYGLGLKDPRSIAYKYNPVTPKAWGSKVYRLMQQMPKY